MPFDPAGWPNAVRVSDLIAERIPLGIHCVKCSRMRGRPGRAAAEALTLSYVPALALTPGGVSILSVNH